MVNNGELTEKQTRTIAALCSYRTLGAALEAVKVSRTTLARWRKQPEFIAALEAAQRESLAGLSRSLVVLSDKATAALENTFDDAEAAPGVKVRAAEVVLVNMLRVAELVDLEQRISELERQVTK
jgi:hypothetical protein